MDAGYDKLVRPIYSVFTNSPLGNNGITRKGQGKVCYGYLYIYN